MKRNVRMVLRYDGTRYLGWARQPGKDMTIQGKIEAVLEKMTGSPVQLIGAGRTDAGVHARAQVCNAIFDTELSEEEILSHMNRYLPEDIGVVSVKFVSDRFHSRYNASGKTYRYTFWIDTAKPVFERKYVTILEKKPDTEAIRRASQFLLGEHDFKSFCTNSHMKKSTVRTVDSIRIEEKGSAIRMYFHGNGFLQNMVRVMAGTLLEAGYGRIRPEDIPLILEARDRSKAGPTAPPQGLMLMKVDY
ncbi:MAG: tRNA pseudouridine(38-40) synthase TruA [Lachnospiraceae bacterium]|nr:tRNA pseudouridine(38-40) synthase TruA [Lachnospiraceae bacterium]